MNQPTPDPSQEGNCPPGAAPLMGGELSVEGFSPPGRGWGWVQGHRARTISANSLPIRCGEGDRRLHETLQLEIIAVLESLNRLRGSPDYELCQIVEKKPGVLDELAAERKQLLEKESGELQKQADKLAEEIKELSGDEASSRIA